MRGDIEHAIRSNPTDATVDLNPDIGRPRPREPDIGGTIAAGRVLRNRYVIQEKLGAGGKGTVFRALDRYRSSLPDRQQYVALKVLHSGGDCSEQTIANLRRELHFGQRLSHRNIVNVFELDRDEDIVFFTMELLDGALLGSVIDRMRPGSMQRSQAWVIIRQLCAGLAHAHERGIVHGDLKPRNVFVTREGELRILDFGSAQKILRAQPNVRHAELASVSGTPAYASCEQLEGRPADPRDDLYALACICYELLTGSHPFGGRPATLARNFGVNATRPAGLSGRQWKTLQMGLSWHRAARSMSVARWVQRLTAEATEEPSITPLRELKPAGTAKPIWHTHYAAACIAMLLIGGACVAQLRATSAQKAIAVAAVSGAAPGPVKTNAPEADAPPGDPSPAGALVIDGQAAGAKQAAFAADGGEVSARPVAPAISVDGHQVRSGDHFVEIRVHRSQLRRNSSFAWWTEPATARQGIDYVNQARAIQTFPPERLSTRFYVKLLPDSQRSQRDYFYLAIAQSGHDRTSAQVTRTKIWLPMPRDQLQARQ
jgi:protein kinase-like protein